MLCISRKSSGRTSSLDYILLTVQILINNLSAYFHLFRFCQRINYLSWLEYIPQIKIFKHVMHGIRDRLLKKYQFLTFSTCLRSECVSQEHRD